jgi:hypothetical protein
MDSITQRQMQITCIFPGNGGRGQIQLEEAYAVEITKLVEYVDRKEDPLRHCSSTNTSTEQCYRQLDASRQNYIEEQEK